MALLRPSIVIVGGGIGGLFAANALVAQGLKVSVYEQAPELNEVGAGVYITPNCVRQLQRVGVGPAVEKWGARVGTASRYFYHDGKEMAGVQVTDRPGTRPTACIGPTSSTCWRRRCREASYTPTTSASATSAPATWRA